MRIKDFPNGLRGVLLALAAVIAADSALLAAPPDVKVPEGRILAETAKQIGERVKYWINQIRDAKDEKAVLDGRNGLINDYTGLYDSQEFRYNYAEQAAKLAPAYLKITDPAKLTSVAIALSKMQQVAVQPALELMVGHTSPAVRYLGWDGYAAICPAVLAQGTSYAKTMYDSMEKAAADEPSGPTVGLLFEMLTAPASPPAAVPAEALNEFRRRCLDILQKVWQARCKQVLAGDAEMADACRAGIRAWRSMADAADKNRLRSQLQAVLDAAWCSSRAYDEAEPRGRVADFNEQLLLECEAAMNALKGTQRNYLQSALLDAKVTSLRGVAVRRAVIEKWMDDLKADGLTDPAGKFPAAKTASGPAGTAASGPASAPGK